MKIIGHRGARGLAPENTMPSFLKALEHHADEVEFDVRVTKDGIPVLSHDAAAKDVAGNTLIVRQTTYQDLKAHKPDLTTLDEVFTTLPRTAQLYIEVKPNEPVAPIVSVIQNQLQQGWSATQLSLASFSQPILRELHVALPDITKVVIERWSGTRAVIHARQVNTRRLSMKQIWLWRGFLQPMHRRGWLISPYTLNDPKKVKKWQPYLYGIITDFPDRFEK